MQYSKNTKKLKTPLLGEMSQWSRALFKLDSDGDGGGVDSGDDDNDNDNDDDETMMATMMTTTMTMMKTKRQL